MAKNTFKSKNVEGADVGFNVKYVYKKNMAVVDLEGTLINCYFNNIDDLDFDALYDDILNNENLRKVINFVSSMSDAIDKPFYLEEDNYSSDNKLVEIYKNKISIIAKPDEVD